MDVGDYYRLLSEKTSLIGAMIAFNRPASSEDDSHPLPTWLKENQLFLKISALPRFRPFFPRETGAGLWDFQDETRRLALVEAETFHLMCLHWGAAVFSDDLAAVIEREEVARLKSQLGQDVYQFALNRGRFCLGSLKKIYRPEKADLESLSVSVLRRVGLWAVWVCAGDWPEELREKVESRFKTKLAGAPGQPRSPQLAGATWPWLKRILLEIAPQWQPCFA
jgi:hypothetical protein